MPQLFTLDEKLKDSDLVQLRADKLKIHSEIIQPLSNFVIIISISWFSLFWVTRAILMFN